EDFSDVGSTTVSKVAFGYRPFEPVLIRGSWSEAFRAPNLVTINEAQVARSNTRNDFGCLVVDPDETVLDCRYGMQRTAAGSKSLRPETSDNYSLGLVFEPVEGLTITYDKWSIEKSDTIGLFGEENHIALDLLRRLSAGTSNCAAVATNPAVVRDTDIPTDSLPLFAAAGLCPFGEVARVDDDYTNLDKRTVEGTDIGIYYDVETELGDFGFRYVGTFMDKFEQEAGGQAAELVAAQAAGALPASVPVVGFASLIGQNGNPERKDTVRASWSKGDWAVRMTGLRYGDFVQLLSNGQVFPIPEMTTFNLSVDYNFSMIGDIDSRIRLGMNNVQDERAPLADDSFGYFADQHRDLGRYYYVDLRFRLL
ncbi:MAG TPA: TonB-dependent receptor, partial [Gammaproteobacteria bacterium]|nr:TonB-dependent receptor [Gammaproteobacteria bacterium]